METHPAFIAPVAPHLSARLRSGAGRRLLRQGLLFQLFARSRQTRSGGSQRRTSPSLSGRGWIIRPRRASTRSLSVPAVLVVGFSGLALFAPGEGPGARDSFPGDLLGTPATRPAGRSTEQ